MDHTRRSVTKVHKKLVENPDCIRGKLQLTADASNSNILGKHASQYSPLSGAVQYAKKCKHFAGLQILAKLHLIRLGAETEGQKSTAHKERYKPLSQIGSGGKGEVRLCRDSKTGTIVAVKTLLDPSLTAPPNEVHALILLGEHENIVRYYGMLDSFHQPLRTQLVFEWCALGDLAEYIRRATDGIPEMFVWHIFQPNTTGRHYMHTADVVHGDLKPANILLAPARAKELYPTFKM
jgi:hypothetical protein